MMMIELSLDNSPAFQELISCASLVKHRTVDLYTYTLVYRLEGISPSTSLPVLGCI